MATISPSSDSAPSGVPPTSSPTPPVPSVTPPTASSDIVPNANPPEPATPSTPSPPPSSAPPPSNSGPPAVTPPPAESSPPPTPSDVPPSNPVAPPPTPVTPQTPPPVSQPPPQTPPPTGSPPPVSQPPPQTPPPTGSPPPVLQPSPQTPPPTNSPPPVSQSPPQPQTPPPTSSPPPVSQTPPQAPPPTSSPPPVSAPPPIGSPPPTTTPTPPSAEPPESPPPSLPLSPNPPVKSPPPSSSEPPSSSPPPPASTPPEKSPTPPASQPPRSSPSPPDAPPPKDTPPSAGDSPPPSAPPPSLIPGITPPVFQSPPSPGAQITPPSPPSSSGNKSSSGPSQTANNAPSKGGIGIGGEIAVGVIAGIVILGLIGLVGLWIFKRRKRSSGANDGHVIPASIGSSPRSDIKLLVKTEYPGSHFGGGSGTDTPTDHGGFGQSRSWFTYHELSEATGGFSDENLLGEGGFGCVYKGLLADGRVIAVKQLKVGGGQGEREFRAEVEIISRIHHRHLVSLVGYCIWESRRLLVYEYVPNDTLHFHLHGGGTSVMDWATRVKIAVGAARGIAYLHEDCHPRIIHRDIKSSNILLDNNFEARVSDFGLAKLALDADTHVSTRVMGTFGYLAPEYATTGKLTEKSDVYSFGVVLLELITGRKPVDESQPLGDESLVEWARPLLAHAIDKGEFEAIVDPRLEKNYIETEMFRMIEAAAACVRHSSSKRPRMGQVVRALSLSDSGDLSNGLRVGESQLYDSAQQSAHIRWFRRMAFGSQDIGSDISSIPSQNLGFSAQSRQGNPSQNAAQSRQNVSFSAPHGQVGNMSRQHSQDSQNIAFPSQTASISSEHGVGSNISRQHGYNPHHST